MKKISTSLLLTITLLLNNYTNTVSHNIVSKETTHTEHHEKKTSPLTPDEFDDLVYTWSRIMAHVLQLVRQKHFKVVELESSMTKGINEMLSTLDPHSGLLDPKTYRSMLESTSGEFFGTGIVIDRTRKTNDKFLTVIDTIPAGPAEKAGVLPLDKIVEIEDEDLEYMTTEEAINKLKGPKNSTVKIKVMRNNHHDLITCEITRDVVKEQSTVAFDVKDHTICYISLTSFSETAAKDIERILKKTQDKKLNGIILDLRNNSGGLLTSVIDICGLFLPQNSTVVITKNKNGASIQTHKTTRKPLSIGNTPIIVLINNYTASAAEILAGCLKIYSDWSAQNKRDITTPLNVILMGTTSFGKGSVQELIPIEHNCAVKLTTALYFLPDDSTIQAIGIEPDIFITKYQPPTEESTWFIKQYGHEKSFENHIKTPLSIEKNSKNTKTKKNKEKESHIVERAKKMFNTDNQVREAVNFINLINQHETIKQKKSPTRTDITDLIKSVYIGNNHIEITEIKDEQSIKNP